VTIVVSEAGLLQVDLFPADHHSSPDFLPQEPAPDCLDLALHQIESYLNGALNTFSIPIDWSQQSPFQQIVLKAAMQIPYGEIVTYGQLASSIGRPSAARAVPAVLWAATPCRWSYPATAWSALTGDCMVISGGLATKAGCCNGRVVGLSTKEWLKFSL
jgi:hypothetical protein